MWTSHGKRTTEIGSRQIGVERKSQDRVGRVRGFRGRGDSRMSQRPWTDVRWKIVEDGEVPTKGRVRLPLVDLLSPTQKILKT